MSILEGEKWDYKLFWGIYHSKVVLPDAGYVFAAPFICLLCGKNAYIYG